MRANRDRARIFEWVATPSRIAISSAALLNVGSAPGRPRTTGSVSELGGAPNVIADDENALEWVASWTWISRPITGSQVSRMGARSVMTRRWGVRR